MTLTLDGVELGLSWNEVTIPCASEEEYFRLTERIECPLCELADGELIVMSPVHKPHQDVFEVLFHLFGLFVSRRGLGRVKSEPYPMRLAPGLIRMPDILFVRSDREHLLAEKHLEGAADLAIEVVSDSASSRRRDLVHKREEYERHGVREYWAIDHARGEIVAHRLGEDGRYEIETITAGRLESTACDGSWIDAEWVLGAPPADPWQCLEALLGPSFGKADRAAGD